LEKAANHDQVTSFSSRSTRNLQRKAICLLPTQCTNTCISTLIYKHDSICADVNFS